MRIFDAHCDVLYKMWLNPTLQFKNANELHITFEQLKKTKSRVQCFAIYIPENVRQEDRFEVALEMIEIFYRNVISVSPGLKVVRSKQEIESLKEGEIGAVLTLEGCDAIGESLTRLQALIRLGVTSVGLTWNNANYVADGILEERGAGLSSFGKEVVKELNRSKIWTDVSHLSIKGFWDVMELAEYPIASHSNVYNLCQHPRNLHNDQIKGLIERNGMIGVTFVPQFVTNSGHAEVKNILKHIEYICALGGVNNLGFGSDFDGITETVLGLSRYSEYDNLINLLLKTFTEDQVKGFLYENFVKRFPLK